MIRLVLMMTVLSALFVAVGYVIGLFFGDPELWALGALVIALLLNAFSYLFSDKIALSMSHAKIVSVSEQPTLHRIVSSLAASAGLPEPKVAIINSPAPNAFATGRGPNNSVVAVTTGLMGIVN
jgi:heat shock protein HtpX